MRVRRRCGKVPKSPIKFASENNRPTHWHSEADNEAIKKKTKLSSRSNFSQLLRTSVEKVLMIPVFGPP